MPVPYPAQPHSFLTDLLYGVEGQGRLLIQPWMKGDEPFLLSLHGQVQGHDSGGGCSSKLKKRLQVRKSYSKPKSTLVKGSGQIMSLLSVKQGS